MLSRITEPYFRHDKSRICQGDILRDVEFYVIHGDDITITEVFFDYMVVMSQDCDLEQGLKGKQEGSELNNQFLHSILLVPAFIAEKLREGEHLEGFDVKQARIDSKRWNVLKDNRNPRYHYLLTFQALQVPELVVDFKTFYTLGVDNLLSTYGGMYLATISELFREELSRRFTNYLSRIALPEVS